MALQTYETEERRVLQAEGGVNSPRLQGFPGDVQEEP
jgi:hypothetical protein